MLDLGEWLIDDCFQARCGEGFGVLDFRREKSRRSFYEGSGDGGMFFFRKVVPVLKSHKPS